MKPLLPIFAYGLLVLAGCGTPQDDVAVAPTPSPVDSTPAPAPAVTEPVADAPVMTEPLVVSPEDQLKTLTNEFNTKYSEYKNTYRNAKSAEDRQTLAKTMPKADEYADRFLELAEAHPESDAAVDALVWIAQRVPGEKGEQATKMLLQSHSDNEKLQPMMMKMIMSMAHSKNNGVNNTLREILECPNEKIRGVATYTLGSRLMKEDAKSDEALAMLRTVVNDYSELSFKSGTRDYKIAPLAKAALFEAENLQMGMTAPDIEAADLDGVDFKLSDYRGKIVLLDFWGHW